MYCYKHVTCIIKYTRLILFIVCALYAEFTLYTKSACIIVHGTWASQAAWYRPSGDFFEAVYACNQELHRVDEVVSFVWSGTLNSMDRYAAAQNLAEIIMQYDDGVILIAHSHGVTVGIIASQLIHQSDTNGNNTLKIAAFYALGVPVDEMSCKPNMLVIKTFYNLFSFGDVVQTINGTCKRCYQPSEGIINLSVQLCDYHPSHEQLHHPAIGRQLLKIDNYFAQKHIGNFESFSYNHPGMILFYEYQNPVYMTQPDQEQTLRMDEQAHKLATYAFFRRVNFDVDSENNNE